MINEKLVLIIGGVYRLKCQKTLNITPKKSFQNLTNFTQVRLKCHLNTNEHPIDNELHTFLKKLKNI